MDVGKIGFLPPDFRYLRLKFFELNRIQIKQMHDKIPYLDLPGANSSAAQRN